MIDGIYYDLGIDDYHNDKSHYSASGLKYAIKSMRHFYYYKQGAFDLDNSNIDKPHLDFGNIVEMALLDRDSIDSKVAVFDPDQRPESDKTFASKLNKEWKERFYADNSHKYIMNKKGPHSKEALEHIFASVMADKIANAIIKHAQSQISCFWTDKSGLKIKTRPDCIIKDRKIVFDIKTAEDASPASFRRAACNYHYFFQAAMQIDGVIKAGLMDRVDDYYWLVIEKTAPYNVQVYRYEEYRLVEITEQYRALLSRVAEAENTNLWPGYGDQANEVFNSQAKYGVIDLTPFPSYEIYNLNLIQ